MEFTAPISFDEAAEFLAAKQLLPTSLGSKQLSTLSGELRRRAFFSARVASADFLAEAQTLTEQLAAGLNADGSFGAEGDSPMMSIAEAKARLQKHLKRIGYTPNAGEEGTIKDLSSDARVQLIAETNLLDAQGHGQWVGGNDPVALDVLPAWELVRFGNPAAPRNWEERWDAARANAGEEGTTHSGSGRMVALKNHPIWQALGDGEGGYDGDALGNPWPPFAFNSSMNIIEVDRGDAIELGILGEDETLTPASEQDFNEQLETDASRFPAALQDALTNDGELIIRNGVLTLAGKGAA